MRFSRRAETPQQESGVRANLGPYGFNGARAYDPRDHVIAGTRVALGIGVGLLISDRLNKDQRKAAGWALLGVGVLTTIPIVSGVLGKPAVE